MSKPIEFCDLALENPAMCDMCGKPRSRPGGHPKCAKKRQEFYRSKKQ